MTSKNAFNLADMANAALMALAQQPDMPAEQRTALKTAAAEVAGRFRFRVDAEGALAVYAPIAPDKYKRVDEPTAHAVVALLTACGIDVTARSPEAA